MVYNRGVTLAEEGPLDASIQHSERISLSVETGLAGTYGERAEQTTGGSAAATDETTINGM
jgi:hypothetical protein